MDDINHGQPADGRRSRRRDRVVARFPAGTRSVGRARELVASLLRARDWPDEVVEAAKLATSELATNAIVHAESDFEVRCRVDDDVRIEVVDRKPSAPVTPATGDWSSASGRGLRIVDASSTRWGVERTREHKTVWCVLSRPALGASAS